MPYEVTLRKTDGTLCLDLPDDVIDHCRYKDGDRVHLIEMSQGLLIVPYDDDFADAMTVYEDGIDAYEDALRTLADQEARTHG